MKKLFVALALCGALLTGCDLDGHTDNGGSSPNETFGVRSNPHYVNLPDGRKVLCVYEATGYSSSSGGPSCDWANAK
ncbi:hypothetical protein [Mycobacterium intracellulare]|uniref:Lipoprotein n=1 Tax=Mycobacterium intracellulare TaxID=1767 RepID=A0AAE4RD54_MYCIT|nr:hypothetical protein [Mycobacterium intracellulare]MDV6975298.1 hypothetical protein [Mycobacterium intracellulare]MDV6980362.1 hypothetical protein [Mycobacterium intracellulare]MDV7010791.1 hypothetical protein [Mycobacterium intracellulare]MDV7025697.1 hypothetical protein [Mycobacterium intracellulare]